MKKELYSVEWSESQKCFHVDCLSDIVNKNLQLFFSLIESDWVLIGVFNTHNEAHDFVRLLREKRGIPTLMEKFNELAGEDIP